MPLLLEITPLVFVTLMCIAFYGVAYLMSKNDNKKSDKEKKEWNDQSYDAPGKLNPSEILELEFEYAQATASEAMRDRHLTINFHLIIFGVTITGLLTYLASSKNPLTGLDTFVLWFVSIVGCFFFFIQLSLRSSWHDSVRTMNQIKDYYLFDKGSKSTDLKEAFRWKSITTPKKDKRWNVFYFSSALSALLNVVSFYAGTWLLFKKSECILGLKGEYFLYLIFPILSIAWQIVHMRIYHRVLRIQPRETETDEQ